MKKKPEWMKDKKILRALAVPGALLLVLILANMLFLEHWMESDFAAEMIFSKLLSETGHYIASPDWYYSTEFRIFYTQLVMVPLFKIFRSWTVIRMLTNFVFYALMLWSYAFLVGPLKVPATRKILASSLLLVPFSETMAQHVHFGNTYIAHMILMFWVTGLVLRLADPSQGAEAESYGASDGTGKAADRADLWQIWYLTALTVLSLICGASGVRYFLSVYGPLVLAGGFLMLQGRNFRVLLQSRAGDEKTLRQRLSEVGAAFRSPEGAIFRCSLGATLIALIGYAFNVTYIRSHYSFTTYENLNFIQVINGELLLHLQNAFGSLLELLGYIPQKEVLGLRGLITVLSFALLGIGAFVTWQLSHRCRHRSGTSAGAQAEQGPDPTERFFVYFFRAAFWLMTFFLVFTYTTITPRYYLLVLALFVPLVLIYDRHEDRWLQRSLVLGGLCLILLLTEGKILYSMAGADKNAGRAQAAAFLEEKGYTFGYSTYEHANMLQELSDGAVEAAGIILEDGGMRYFRWSSAEKYYEPGYAKGPVFLLLSEAESEKYADYDLLQQGREIYREGGYVIYGYPDASSFAQE